MRQSTSEGNVSFELMVWQANLTNLASAVLVHEKCMALGTKQQMPMKQQLDWSLQHTKMVGAWATTPHHCAAAAFGTTLLSWQALSWPLAIFSCGRRFATGATREPLVGKSAKACLCEAISSREFLEKIPFRQI